MALSDGDVWVTNALWVSAMHCFVVAYLVRKIGGTT